ncbi:MAG: 5-formyltetrahydrofolate cyclo-ligase [Alphaproteobacteria bacterium]|nr:5-formyltetrahydrofolate cyclo-ligase [Alphaproteobacteria bacterium]
MNKQQEKQNYREHARAHRDQMDVDATDFEAVIDIFFKEINPPQNQIISLYWPVDKEFDCRFLMDELVKKGFQCALPCIQKETRVLTFKTWTHDTKMASGAFDIPEPVEGEEVVPDIVIAPLLAFDQKGYRLGTGGGYYDTTLEHLRAQKDVTYMGIGFAEQAVLFKLPREDHDIPMDYMITPQGVIDFKDARL